VHRLCEGSFNSRGFIGTLDARCRSEFRGCENIVQSGETRRSSPRDSACLIARSRGKYAPRHVHRPQCRSGKPRSRSLIRRFPEARGKIAPSFLAGGNPEEGASGGGENRGARDSSTVKLAPLARRRRESHPPRHSPRSAARSPMEAFIFNVTPRE
jgi:hypothetical protein